MSNNFRKISVAAMKTIRHIQKYGIAYTCRKIRNKFCASKIFPRQSDLGDMEFHEKSISLLDTKISALKEKKIAVHLHLFYQDLLEEFVHYIKNIPYEFDLFLSCRQGDNLEVIEEYCKNQLSEMQKIRIEAVRNQGRDIAPFYVSFGKELKTYDYILHVHSKKSLYSGSEQSHWRQHALQTLLPGEQDMCRIFSLMEQEKIGLFFPESPEGLPLFAHTWLSSEPIGRELINRMGLKIDKDIFNYPVGSFFWAKGDAIRPLFNLNLSYEDFPKECGQTDGTLAHALERAVSFVVRGCGYHLGIYDRMDGVVRVDVSKKFMSRYFLESKETMLARLINYDLITFDVFDTLITRAVYEPDDVFRLIEAKLNREKGEKVEFFRLRKEAEKDVVEQVGNYCTLTAIYKQLGKVAHLSMEELEHWMALEIETEVEVSLPREDVRWVFQELVKKRKRILLVSDMYLEKIHIEKLLQNHGYQGYEDIWVSCEVGNRKDDGSMWTALYKKFDGVLTIHVGDHPCHDIQKVSDLGKDCYWVLNARQLFQLSPYDEQLRPYMNPNKFSIKDSILFGLFINGGIFNSPFALCSSGNIISEGKMFGYAAFGALFSAFMEWVIQEIKNDEIKYLLFLSREGYLFQQIFQIFCDKTDVHGIYFLASRRANSLAAVKSREDIQEILQPNYVGKLSGLLWERLGMLLPEGIPDIDVMTEVDLHKIMNILTPYMDNLLLQAEKERIAYMEYIMKVLPDYADEKLAVVDVGYSGTIQYFLSKMLDKPVSGYYVCTSVDKKPLKINCKIKGYYDFTDYEEMELSPIYISQLFLEAALQAPYGQLICFQKDEIGNSVPKYRDDRYMNAVICDVQEGILTYCRHYASLVRKLGDLGEDSSSRDLGQNILWRICTGRDVLSKLYEQLTVQDAYCAGGERVYQPENGIWGVREEKNEEGL